MKAYHDHIDYMIIKILYENKELSSGELKKQLDQSLVNHGYKKTSPDTYWGRLRQLTSSNSNKQSKYVIQPVLTRNEEIPEGKIRGITVKYELTKTTKIRHALQIPILKSESKKEMAYRLIFYYIMFGYTQLIKLKDDDEYNALLEKLSINKSELEQLENPPSEKFKITKWTHPKSEIEFTRKDYLKPSGKEGAYDYFCMLPGFPPSDFLKIKELSLPYRQLNFSKDEVIQYFELLEKQNLIRKIKLKQLVNLEEEIFTLADNSLKDILLEIWTLYSHVLTYLIYIWQGIRSSKDEERIWYEHMYGKSQAKKWFEYCHDIRTKYRKNASQVQKNQTQEKLKSEKLEIIKKFESIPKEYTKTINDYSYFIEPLLNVVYPQFLRKEFKQ